MVYVVDDGADYRFLLGQVFAKFLPHYPVRFFADGEDLRQHVLAQGERSRMVLLDVDMPILNGLETLRFLKQQPAWRYVPTVMMTNSVGDAMIEACYAAGASSFLIKPTNVEQMHQHLEWTCRYWLTLNQVPQRHKNA